MMAGAGSGVTLRGRTAACLSRGGRACCVRCVRRPGDRSVHIHEGAPSAEAYYWVTASVRRQGVASTALGLLADWAFDHDIERLYLLFNPRTRRRIESPHVVGSPGKESCAPSNASRAIGEIWCPGRYFRTIGGRGGAHNCRSPLADGRAIGQYGYMPAEVPLRPLHGFLDHLRAAARVEARVPGRDPRFAYGVATIRGSASFVGVVRRGATSSRHPRADT